VAVCVIDTSSLIFLSRLRRLELARIPGTLVVPRAVMVELLRGQRKDPDTVDWAVTWMKKERVSPLDVQVPADFFPTLGAGERAVLRAATEATVATVLIDDRAARRAARHLALRTVSTPYLLLKAVHEGILSAKTGREDLDRLVGLGYFLDPKLYADLREDLYLLDGSEEGGGH
jgi:predicted nucleic acid-binding protein